MIVQNLALSSVWTSFGLTCWAYKNSQHCFWLVGWFLLTMMYSGLQGHPPKTLKMGNLRLHFVQMLFDSRCFTLKCQVISLKVLATLTASEHVNSLYETSDDQNSVNDSHTETNGRPTTYFISRNVTLRNQESKETPDLFLRELLHPWTNVKQLFRKTTTTCDTSKEVTDLTIREFVHRWTNVKQLSCKTTTTGGDGYREIKAGCNGIEPVPSKQLIC